MNSQEAIFEVAELSRLRVRLREIVLVKLANLLQSILIDIMLIYSIHN